jgi:hypothetical protein
VGGVGLTPTPLLKRRSPGAAFGKGLSDWVPHFVFLKQRVSRVGGVGLTPNPSPQAARPRSRVRKGAFGLGATFWLSGYGVSLFPRMNSGQVGGDELRPY